MSKDITFNGIFASACFIEGLLKTKSTFSEGSDSPEISITPYKSLSMMYLIVGCRSDSYVSIFF